MSLIDDKTLDVPVGLSLNSLTGIFPTESDPSVSGLDLPIGSLALHTAGKLWQKTGSESTAWTERKSGIFDPGHCVIVAVSGGDYTSIKAACDYVATQTPSATNPWSVLVYPGAYTEDAFTVPNFCNMIAVAGLSSATISPNTATDTLVTCGSYSEIFGFRVAGCNGVGGIGIKSTSFQSLVRSCVISDCETGMYFTGSGANVILQDCILSRPPSTVLTTGIKCDSSATVVLQAVTAAGTAISQITDGILIDNANVTLASVPFSQCVRGMDVKNGAFVIASGYRATDCTTGIRLDGSTTVLQANACGIRGGTTNIEILNTDVSGYYRGSADFEKVVQNNNQKLYIDVVTFDEGEEGFRFTGDTSIGSHEFPSRLSTGTGHAVVEDQYVLTNTNGEAGTWNNITTEATSPSGSTFSFFAGTGAGNCCYIGVKNHEFPAIYIQGITTVLNAGTSGSLVLEYWNGTAWVSVNILSTQGKEQYAQAALMRLGEEIIRFGYTTNWTKKTLNGLNAYWMRYRITSAITTIPVAERMEHFLDAAVFQEDGFLSYYGEAEKVGQVVPQQLYELDGFMAADETIEIGANTRIKMKENKYTKGNKDGSGSYFTIPAGLDTSKPITLRVDFAPKDDKPAGDVSFSFYAARLSEGLVWDGTATEISGSSLYSIPANSSLKGFQTTVDLLIPNALPGESYAFSIIRDASDGNPDDTLDSDVFIASTNFSGVFWR